MKFPVRLIWDLIGDAFEGVFDDDNRRPIDLLWQTYAQLGGDALDYVDSYKRARNLFEVDLYPAWGSFPSTPELVGITSQIDGLIVGHDGSRWVILTECNQTIPSSGNFSLLNTSVPYTFGSSKDLLSECRVSEVTSSYTETPWDIENNPSFVFGTNTSLDGSERWSDEGTPAILPRADGILLRPQWSNWSILRDTFYMDGAQSWEQLWRFRIDKWETNNSYTRALSVGSYGDAGADYEVRLEDTGTTIQVSSGMFAKTKYVEMDFSGSTISRSAGSFSSNGFRPGMVISVLGSTSNDGSYNVVTVTPSLITVAESFTTENSVIASITNSLEVMTGDTTGWRNTLLASDTDSPVYIEFLIRYSASTAEMYSEVYLGNRSVEQTNTYTVSPGRRTQSVEFHNQVLDAQLIIEWMAVRTGKLWNSTKTHDFTTAIGRYFGYVYQVPEPITSSSNIQWGAYDLAPLAEVISHTPSTEITLEINEDYKNYAPKYARIEGNSHVIGELLSQTDSEVTYTIVSESSPGLQFIGNVQLHPWFITQAEFEWIEPGVFTTEKPLPFDNEQCFFIDTRAEELDLYNRFGKLLQMPPRDDSKSYLDALRGMEFGLTTPHTPDHTSRGIGILLGLPYTNETGFVEDVQRVTNDLGGALYDNVVVNGRTVVADPSWYNNGLLLPVGSYVEKLTPIVDSVVIYDWKTGLSLIQERVNIWKSWGTTLVQIPGSIGLNATRAGDLIRYLDRTKGVHTDYIIEFLDSRSEDQFNDTFDDIEVCIMEPIAHTLEDMVFDDQGEVVLNDLDYYPNVGGSIDYPEDWQQPDTLTLDTGHKLGQFEALDATSLRVFDVKKIHNGLTQGGDTWPQRPDFKYDFRNSGIDMNRSLNADELAGDMTRSFLRMSSPNDGQTYFNRPYSLCFPFTGASPQWSVRDGGGTLYTYHTQSYDAQSPTNTEDLYDAYIQDSNLAWVVGDNGTIFETVDYGENWTDKTITTTDDFRGTHRLWVVGTNTSAYERVAGTWTARVITVSAVSFVDIFWIDDLIGWAVANNGADCESYKTIDGGANWDTAVSINTTVQVTAVHFADALNGWCSTNDGLYRTTDGGATWAFKYDTGVTYNGVHCISADVVVAIDNATNGNIIRSTNGTVTTPSWGVVETLTTNQFNDVHFMNSLFGTAVGTGGSAYHSYDGGVTWASETISSEVWTGVHTASPWFRLVVGPNAGTDDVSRWR